MGTFGFAKCTEKDDSIVSNIRQVKSVHITLKIIKFVLKEIQERMTQQFGEISSGPVVLSVEMKVCYLISVSHYRNFIIGKVLVKFLLGRNP
jgi:hypothetical protein